MSATAAGPRVVTLGETMALLRTHGIGSLTHVGDLAVGVGGAESNTAIALRRLGVDVAWVGRVGDDPLGLRVAREIRAEGVETLVTVDPDAPTGVMLKERPTSRSTAVWYYRAGSAGSRLRPEDVPEGLVESADVLHVTGITPLLSPSAAATLDVAVDRARAAGTTVCFDVNHRSSLAAPDVAAPVLRAVADRADLLVGSPDELRLVGGIGTTAEQVARSLATGGRDVVAKLGPDGALACLGPGGVERSAGFRVEVVDTVGAGDAFVAGYLDGLLRGLPTSERLRRANACGALLCMTPGDWESSPRPPDLAAFDGSDTDPVRR